MPSWKSIRTGLTVALDRLSLIVGGGWLMVMYLAWTHPEHERELNRLSLICWLSWFILFAAHSVMRVKSDDPKPIREPTAASGGTAVVIVTGLAVAGMFAVGAVDWMDYVLVGTTLAATAALAIFVWRFASQRSSEIGEARFVTGRSTSPPD